jgi:uncharacterized membrane protein YkvA (DUF1232 family)
MFPKKTIILVLAGVLYFFNPFDIIPDYILYIGFIDDIAVCGQISGAHYGYSKIPNRCLN